MAARHWRSGLGLAGTAAVLALLAAPWLNHTVGRSGDDPARLPNPVSEGTGAPVRVVMEDDRPLARPADFAALVEEALPAAIPAGPPPTEERAEEPSPVPIVAETPRPAEPPAVTQVARAPEPDHPPEPLATASVPAQSGSALRDADHPLRMSRRGGVRSRAARQVRAATWKAQTRASVERPARPVAVRSAARASTPAPASEARAWSLPRALQPTVP